ncbi:HAD-IA family hydrolase [Candidatus Babeliales bacterium]|nr:HAD-IA family hydrolase [Candidatus Babeliales bacterium]MBP9843769.1 HAD-IA family hydrolase [Candidatus Babeliales bacterium]
MIKKMVLQHQKLPKQLHIVKTIIFDLSGVLLIKKTAQDFIQAPQATASMVAVNFLETIALLKACKASGHKLFVLSNLSIPEFDRIKQEPEIASLFSFFDDIVISAMTPYEKPDHQIFTYFCQQYNLQPADCVFIDDKQDNLDGAQAASIYKTILCSNFDLQHVKNELVSFGVLHQSDAIELNIPTGQA